jgi:tellurite resistance protein TerC
MTVPLWAWIATLAVFTLLIAVDLIRTRKASEGLRAAALASGFWVAAGLAFGGVLWLWQGPAPAGQYFAGYLLEKALSVDNIFVFVLLFTSLAVPAAQQRRVLYFGVVGALVLRGGFIAAGGALLDRISWVFYVFGALVVLAGVRMARPHAATDPAKNLTVRALRRVLPVTRDYDGGRFFTRAGGKMMATPLFVALVAIETTDLVFALDSIPAVFGVTSQPYIVFTANAFALLGLRALFFLVTGLLDRLVYLSGGLAVILAFIGVKLILHWAHSLEPRVPEISTAVSLIVIAVVLTVTTVASLIKSRRDPAARAHAGAVLGTPPEAAPRQHAQGAGDRGSGGRVIPGDHFHRPADPPGSSPPPARPRR